MAKETWLVRTDYKEPKSTIIVKHDTPKYYNY